MRLGAMMVLCLVAGIARAQSADPLAEAKEHARRATQLYDLGRFLEAANEYEVSFALSDRAPLLFNVGQAYRLGEKPTEAVAAYRGFLRRVPESPLAAEAEQHIRDLERDMAARPRASESAPAAAPSVATVPSPAPSAAPAVAVPAPPAKRRVRPWVWGVVAAGVAVVGVAIGLGVGLTQSRAPAPTDGAVRF